MIQEFISPANNHVFEINNKIKVIDNKIEKINDLLLNILNSNAELKLSIEYLKSNLSSVLTNGHDYVEIAGIKWATMNVGAKSITDAGLYFLWGDTQGYTTSQIGTGDGKKEFAGDYSDCKFTTDKGSTFTKYNGTDKKTVLDLEDDAVHTAWGGSWRMPTKKEINTLLSSTAVTKTWKIDYSGTNVNGYEFHDNNSNDTLFLPACGYASDGEVINIGVFGSYWLSSPNANDVGMAYTLGLNNDNIYAGDTYRCRGICVRGVLDIK